MSEFTLHGASCKACASYTALALALALDGLVPVRSAASAAMLIREACALRLPLYSRPAFHALAYCIFPSAAVAVTRPTPCNSHLCGCIPVRFISQTHLRVTRPADARQLFHVERQQQVPLRRRARLLKVSILQLLPRVASHSVRGPTSRQRHRTLRSHVALRRNVIVASCTCPGLYSPSNSFIIAIPFPIAIATPVKLLCCIPSSKSCQASIWILPNKYQSTPHSIP